MAVEGYTGAAITKAGLAALGKISTTSFAFTFGTAVIAAVAGAILIAQRTDLLIPDPEVSDEAKGRKEEM